MSFYIELYGYLGSFLVVISMLMSSVVKLRVINIAGSIISGTYAFIIGSFPLVLMNTCLIIINVYNLVKLLKVSREYELVKGNTSDAFFAYFIEHYENDIKKYFPGFEKGKNLGNAVYYVFCHETPAGILYGNQNGDEIDIILEYTTPVYRDCSVAKFLYGAIVEEGVRRLVITEPTKSHQQFLKKVGYVFENGGYVKKL